MFLLSDNFIHFFDLKKIKPKKKMNILLLQVLLFGLFKDAENIGFNYNGSDFNF